ncbi:MAG: hypothetical protein JNK15_16505 [Planctomycetes bacterium]|nr:hypothetical protein [Planctomycetota bacterium]
MRCHPIAVVVAMLSTLAAQETMPATTLLGAKEHTYRWVPGFARLADGKEFGNMHGCLVVDRAGNVLCNTDTEHAVIVFSPEGKVLRSWGKDFRGGLHGMCLREEDGKEVLYLAHHGRHEIVKTTIDGEVQWTLGWPQASGIYENEGQYNPTAVAVGPDGRIFAADGYGKSWVHLYDKERKYVKSFGGPGNGPGKMQTPHGLWLDTRGKEPLLLVCDRENHRLQWFTMDGEHVRTMDKDLRRPCNVALRPDGGLAVADLAGRITLLDKDDKLVTHLGDNPAEKLRARNDVKRDQWKDGEFLSPHGIAVDKSGAIYVMDWNFLGRLSKLVPEPVEAIESGK